MRQMFILWFNGYTNTYHPPQWTYFKSYTLCLLQKYLLFCKCWCYYVGKTKLEFWRRIYQHMARICKRDTELSMGTHMALVHNEWILRVKILALDCIHPSPRGDDINKTLLQRELRWIHNIKPLPGLNKAFNFKPFYRASSQGIVNLTYKDPYLMHGYICILKWYTF